MHTGRKTRNKISSAHSKFCVKYKTASSTLKSSPSRNTWLYYHARVCDGKGRVCVTYVTQKKITMILLQIFVKILTHNSAKLLCENIPVTNADTILHELHTFQLDYSKFHDITQNYNILLAITRYYTILHDITLRYHSGEKHFFHITHHNYYIGL